MGAQLEKTVFLLVEDDHDSVLLSQLAFRQQGLGSSLYVVPDGLEAMRYLKGTGDYEDRNENPLPDVILLDLKMPRFSGFDFLAWLHRESPGELKMIPVVVLSTSDHPEDVKRAYALGANAYLIKPLKWTQFQEQLNSIEKFWSEHVETPVVKV